MGMSKLVKREDFPDMVEVWYTDDEQIGTFQTLFCEVHGNGWIFTAKGGADYCIECIKEMCEPKIEYVMPGFENLEENLEKLTIRRKGHADNS
jgi:hypothetical protein